ncbi:MAG: hypothetical protein WCP55_06950 [Lentisphaerota bacterium]
MGVTTGTSITKSSLITAINADVLNVSNALIQWYAGNSNLYPNYGPWSFVSRDYYPDGGTAVEGPSALTTPTTADIGDTLVTASTIYNTFVNYSNVFTRIRRVRILKYYNSGGTYGLSFDQTAYISLNSYFQGTVSVPAGDTANISSNHVASAANMNQFINDLQLSLDGINKGTLTFREYYCHSSCHGNCHNNRGRR